MGLKKIICVVIGHEPRLYQVQRETGVARLSVCERCGRERQLEFFPGCVLYECGMPIERLQMVKLGPDGKVYPSGEVAPKGEVPPPPADPW